MKERVLSLLLWWRGSSRRPSDPIVCSCATSRSVVIPAAPDRVNQRPFPLGDAAGICASTLTSITKSGFPAPSKIPSARRLALLQRGSWSSTIAQDHPASTGSPVSGRRGYSGLPTTVQDKANAVSIPELVCQEQIQKSLSFHCGGAVSTGLRLFRFDCCVKRSRSCR